MVRIKNISSYLLKIAIPLVVLCSCTFFEKESLHSSPQLKDSSNNVITHDTTAYRYQLTKAVAATEGGDSIAAFFHFDKAILKNPSHKEAYYERIKARWKFKSSFKDYYLDNIDPDSEYYRLLQNDPDDILPYIYIHMSFMHVNMTKEAAQFRKQARDHFENLVSQHPKNAQAWFNLSEAYGLLGSRYERQNMKDKRLYALSKTIELEPNMLDALFDRGYEYYSREQYELALIDFKKALQIKENSLYYVYIASCNKSLHRLGEALKVVNTGIEKYPKDVVLKRTKKEILEVM